MYIIIDSRFVDENVDRRAYT